MTYRKVLRHCISVVCCLLLGWCLSSYYHNQTDDSERYQNNTNGPNEWFFPPNLSTAMLSWDNVPQDSIVDTTDGNQFEAVSLLETRSAVKIDASLFFRFTGLRLSDN